MSETVITVENLSKQYRIGVRERYGCLRESIVKGITAPFQRLRRLGQKPPPEETIWALKDVSFEVQKGEVLGIIGRNGAGKTTLLKVLSRITEPTEGEVRIRGRVASLLEVGTGFHPELTGRENIFLNGAVLGMTRKEIQRKFDEIVAFAEVEKFIDTPVKRYSSGMYVRLAFAVAAHLEPEVLLVDEVLAVGDAEFQKKCLGKMGDVAREGRTVLFVSHNMAATVKLCARGLLLSSGRLVKEGSSRETVDFYLGTSGGRTALNVALDSPERSRGRLVYITGVCGLDGSHNETTGITTGSRCAVAFGFATEAFPLQVRFAFGLIDSMGEYCLHCGSFTLGHNLCLHSSRGWIVCRFARLPLMPGTYSVNFMLQDAGGGVLDYLKNAARLTVRDGDYYGSGRLPGAGMGNVLADYDYSVIPDSLLPRERCAKKEEREWEWLPRQHISNEK